MPRKKVASKPLTIQFQFTLLPDGDIRVAYEGFDPRVPVVGDWVIDTIADAMGAEIK